MCITTFISENWLMRLWELAGWMWNQKGRPAGWNLRQELTLMSWDRISSSSRKPQVFLIRPLTDWMRPPQNWGWSPLLQFWGWCEPHLQNNFTAKSRWVFGWTTRNWPGQADTETWLSEFLSIFFLLEKFWLLCCYSYALQSILVCTEWNLWGK